MLSRIKADIEILAEIISKDMQESTKSIFDIKILINSLESFILEVTDSEREFKELKIKKDKNITTNLIYFLTFRCKNNSKLKFVLKIRREISTMNFNMEKSYVKKLSLLELIPKQYFYLNFDGCVLSMEEFINIKHFDEEANELFEFSKNNYLNKIITNLAQVNSIDALDFENHKNSELFFCNFLLEKLSKRSIPNFLDVINFLKTNEDKNVFSYFKEAEDKIYTIENFLGQNLKAEFEFFYNYFKNSQLVFSLIDLHSTNLFIINEQVKFIDFESLSFNFSGFDLANLLMESIYYIHEKQHPFYTYNDEIVEKLYTKEFLQDLFSSYTNQLNKNSKFYFTDLSIEQIYSLFCLSILKSIFENCNMLTRDIFLKNNFDLIFIAAEKLRAYEFYTQKLNKYKN
jgi:thiamine kinase-like enzyme